MKKRKAAIGKGKLKAFMAHDGGPCPLDAERLVETLILTAEGVGSGGVTPARLHSWETFSEDGGLGTVVGYRIAERGEAPLLGPGERL